MARSIADLKKALKKDNDDNQVNSGGYFYPIWNLPKDATTSVRLLEDPDEENPFIVYLKYWEHAFKVGDNFERFPCLKTWGEECPICNVSQSFYKNDEPTKGKRYYKKLFLLARGIVTADGLEGVEGYEESAKGKVERLKFSYQLATKLKSDIDKLENDEVFWDLDNGIDFEIQKQIKKDDKGKEQAQYDLGSGFARRSTSIPEEWRENIPEGPLSDILPEKVPHERLLVVVQKSLAEEDDGGASDSDNNMDEDKIMEMVKRNRSEKSDDSEEKPAKNPKGTTATKPKEAKAAEPEEDNDDILSMISDDNSDSDDDDDYLRELMGDDD